MRQDFTLGDNAYGFFLHQVALLPYTPDQLLAMARQDFERVLAMESYERQRDLRAPELKIAATAEEETARMAKDEANIRRYLTEHQILTVPPDLPHWTIRLAPDYMAALDGFGELDDFTGPSRLHQDGVRWIQPPSNDLPYFWKAYAQDPRTTGVHEGIPGHFFQLSLAWRNPDPIRRQYYDSSANEGIGFYAEEMMLDAGLYDDSPRSREIIYNFARLRALRVEVDVKLALGSSPSLKRPITWHAPCPWTAEPPKAKRHRLPLLPGWASPMKSVSCKSNGCWRNGACSRAASFRCASFTIMYGATGTCRSRCNDGSCWVWTTM